MLYRSPTVLLGASALKWLNVDVKGNQTEITLKKYSNIFLQNLSSLTSSLICINLNLDYLLLTMGTFFLFIVQQNHRKIGFPRGVLRHKINEIIAVIDFTFSGGIFL